MYSVIRYIQSIFFPVPDEYYSMHITDSEPELCSHEDEYYYYYEEDYYYEDKNNELCIMYPWYE